MQISDNKENNILDKYAPVIFTCVSVLALLIVRYALFFYESGDYIHAFKIWIDEYRSMSFLEGLGTNIDMYNLPYMYLLNIISRVNYSDLFLIKFISVFFDFLLAYFVMKIVSLKTNRVNMHILAFVLTLAVPTVFINSAMWGQCDSIYSAFAIGSVYFGLSGRSKASYAFMALALSFKLQAIFLVPILPMFVITNKIKLKDCYMFFAVYIATLFPAIIAGMSISDAFSVYFEQANYFNRLNLNIINIWQFVELPENSRQIYYESFRTAGIYLTGVAVLGLMYFTYVNRSRLVNMVDFIRLAYLFAIIIPFLLPKMHDRYYYMADVLSLTVFLFDKRRWYVPVVTIMCSLFTYEYFLLFWTRTEVIEYKYAVIALLFIIFIVLKDYVTSLSTQRNNDEDSSASMENISN